LQPEFTIILFNQLLISFNNKMQFTETAINGAYLVDIKKIEDERGFFGRTFCSKEFEEMGLKGNMLQTNMSSNPIKGTLRGLHMQLQPFSECKLVRCTRGSIFDVLVDLRPESETYLDWFGVELTATSGRMLYIPEGCAHGYITLEPDTDVMYQVSQRYAPQAERGFLWNDPAFNIQWPIAPELISVKDQSHPVFNETALKAYQMQ